MSRLRVVPIVEGEGEVACIRILLDRIWRELLGGEFVEVVRPIRGKRGQLVKPSGIEEAIGHAVNILKELPEADDPSLVLILIDADDDCPKDLGPKLLEYARAAHSAIDIACVLANVDYETWFVAAAESLTEYLDLALGPPVSESPEQSRHRKAWVEQRFRRTKEKTKYTELKHQPAMTRAMDLTQCRDRSPSFRKLCRELEKRLQRLDASD